MLDVKKRIAEGKPSAWEIDRDLLVGGAKLQDAVYFKLRHFLMSGLFPPGEPLTIRSLADTFGTSMMPVRDALRRLVSEHALELLPNGSVTVPFMSRRRFQELLELRLCIEPMVTRHATLLMTTEKIDLIASHNERMHEAGRRGDVNGYLEANRAFHFGIYAAANPLVSMPIIESFWMQAGACLRWSFTAKGTRSSQDHHADILRALRRNDGQAAARGIIADLEDAADLILVRYEFAAPPEKNAAATLAHAQV